MRRRSAFSLLRCNTRFAVTFDPWHWRFGSATVRIVPFGAAGRLEEPPQAANVAHRASRSRARTCTSPRLAAPLGCDAAELRDDLVAVRLQRLLLSTCHEVDVELVDADRFELPELLRR